MHRTNWPRSFHTGIRNVETEHIVLTNDLLTIPAISRRRTQLHRDEDGKFLEEDNDS